MIGHFLTRSRVTGGCLRGMERFLRLSARSHVTEGDRARSDSIACHWRLSARYGAFPALVGAIAGFRNWRLRFLTLYSAAANSYGWLLTRAVAADAC